MRVPARLARLAFWQDPFSWVRRPAGFWQRTWTPISQALLAVGGRRG